MLLFLGFPLIIPFRVLSDGFNRRKLSLTAMAVDDSLLCFSVQSPCLRIIVIIMVFVLTNNCYNYSLCAYWHSFGCYCLCAVCSFSYSLLLLFGCCCCYFVVSYHLTLAILPSPRPSVIISDSFSTSTPNASLLHPNNVLFYTVNRVHLCKQVLFSPKKNQINTEN